MAIIPTHPADVDAVVDERTSVADGPTTAEAHRDAATTRRTLGVRKYGARRTLGRRIPPTRRTLMPRIKL